MVGRQGLPRVGEGSALHERERHGGVSGGRRRPLEQGEPGCEGDAGRLRKFLAATAAGGHQGPIGVPRHGRVGPGGVPCMGGLMGPGGVPCMGGLMGSGGFPGVDGLGCRARVSVPGGTRRAPDAYVADEDYDGCTAKQERGFFHTI